MSDALDVLDELLPADDDTPLTAAPLDELFVCGEVVDGKVCGESYPDAARLGSHKWQRHKIRGSSNRSADAKAARAKRPDQKPTRRAPAKKAARAARPDPAPIGNRAELYASSLAALALMAYLGIPAFDAWDLDAVNRGAPNLAAALDAAGQQNAAIRGAADLILGGAQAGAYVQLFLACAAIGVPIAAHHGWVPQSAGERFGSMIGVMAPPPPAAPPAPSSSEPATVDVDTNRDRDAETYMHMVRGTAPPIDFDAESRMMRGSGGPIVAGGLDAIPFVVLHDQSAEVNDDDDDRLDEPGPEQLAPETHALA